MPELAEVEYYRKQWLPGHGQEVASVRLQAEKRVFREADTAALKAKLIGQALTHSETHGKQMLFIFGGRHWLGVHLGMTGRTCMEDGNYAPAQHDHLVLKMRSGIQLVFSDPRMFGRIRFASGGDAPEWWAGLPPAVLSDAFTLDYMRAFLARRARAPLKAVLLMQETFPGVGNWMADEILWRCRIHPAARAGALGPKKCIELFDTVREVCEDAMRVIGTNWGRPPDRWLFNHRWKDGGSCPATGKPLRRREIGGRTTCWSPAWQTYRGKT
ncbi:MAG: Fpg/Nei family DNA glycosylase [Opitutales bacterium]